MKAKSKGDKKSKDKVNAKSKQIKKGETTTVAQAQLESVLRKFDEFAMAAVGSGENEDRKLQAQASLLKEQLRNLSETFPEYPDTDYKPPSCSSVRRFTDF